MEKQIIGEKVILRKLKEEDAAYLAYWYNQPKIMFQCGFVELTTIEQEIEAIKNPRPDSDWYAVCDKNGRIVGEIGLLRMWPAWRCTDLTIIIPDPNDQRKGYGTDAIELMFDLAFNHYQMNRIAIGVVGKNIDSLKFYEKVGFKREGIQEQGYFFENEYSDFIMMHILKDEWIQRKNC